MNVSVAIMAHPKRAAFVGSLIPQLPGAQVVWDQRNDRWDTGRRSMLAFDPAADFHLVVQDDAILCKNFLRHVRLALDTCDSPAAFYMGRTDNFSGVAPAEAVSRARERGHRWICAPGPWWGVAVAVRTDDIPAMIQWCDRHADLPNYDRRMASYFARLGRPCWYSVPSLADHRVGRANPSLIPRRGSGGGRTAAWFVGRGPTSWSPHAIDLSQARSGDRTCVVAVAAYEAERWIGECLRSIERQAPLDGWKYEVRVGVDGCEPTSAELTRLGQGHWFSSENVGPYRIRNTLANDGDAVAVFDADDVMSSEDYLATLIRLAGDKGIAGAARIHTDAQGAPTTGKLGFSHGAALFSRAALDRIGGFRDWRIAADWDAIIRARLLGVAVKATRKTHYLRRIHPGALTSRAETALQSRARSEIKALGRRLIVAGRLRVKPVIASMEWRE